MIRSLTARIAAVFLLGAATRLGAQSAIFLDRTYFVRMAPDMGLMYEAQPAIPLFLYSSLDHLYARLRDPNPGWSTGRMVVVTPMFRIRQLTDRAAASSPVRTPSFMPKLTAQFLATRRIRSGVDRGSVEFPLSAIVFGVDGTFGHYSNGQAGCFRANERRKADGSGDCEPDPSAPLRSDTLNTVDGSFSTWYFRAQTHVRFAHYKDSLMFFAVTLAGGVDWHPAFLKPIGGMDSALAAVYGRQRPFGSIEVARRSQWGCSKALMVGWLPCGVGRLRASFTSEYIATRPPGISPHATTTELAWTFDRYAGFGAIVRLHRGQDYYNIALGHELNVTQYGFTFDLEHNDPIPAPGLKSLNADERR